MTGNGVKTGFCFRFCSCKVRRITAHLYADGKDPVERKLMQDREDSWRNEWGVLGCTRKGGCGTGLKGAQKGGPGNWLRHRAVGGGIGSCRSSLLLTLMLSVKEKAQVIS